VIRLVRAFNLYRKVHNISLRDVARETGVGASTLTRLGQGRDIYSSDLAMILIWLLQEEPLPQEGGPAP
jgi:transcriptional regulator with XRE-family HTH domain